MGATPSKEELLSNAQARINREHPVSVKFPEFWENESAFLREKQLIAEIASSAPALAEMLVKISTGLSCGGTIFKMVMPLLCESTENIKKTLLMLEVQNAIDKSAHSHITAKLELVKERLRSAQNEEDMISMFMKLNDANTACYELLILFNDENFYLLKKPLTFAPFFVSFVAIYVFVLKAHYLITKSSQRTPDATRALTMLEEVIRKYQKRTSKARTRYVTVEGVMFSHGNAHVVDRFTQCGLCSQNCIDFPPIIWDVKEWYQDKLGEAYSNYFNESLQMVDKVLESL